MSQRLLLHICCGICAIGPAQALSDRYEVVGFWANPNIQPAEEYEARRASARESCRRLGIHLLEDTGCTPSFWRERVEQADKEGKRCEECYRVRLEQTCRAAARDGVRFVSSTLLVSPHQNMTVLREVGLASASAYGVCFIGESFRSLFAECHRRAREWGLYRQKYCGCLAGKREAEEKRRKDEQGRVR